MSEVRISTVELTHVVMELRAKLGNPNTVRHDNMTKKVIHRFKERAEQYASTYTDSIGARRKCYALPKFEAVAIVNSYGTEYADAVHALMTEWERNGKTEILTKKPKVEEVQVQPIPTIPTVSKGAQDGPVTMTSLELVSFINSVRAEDAGFVTLKHDDFLRKVRTVLGDTAGNFAASYSSTFGDRPMYRFPKREATLMAMSYSHKVSAQVYDRMESLERQVSSTSTLVMSVPQTFTEALRLALEQAEKLEQQQIALATADRELALAAPKVVFHEKFVATDDLYTATDVAKKLSISAVRLNAWLDEKNVLFANRKHFKQWYIAKGFGVEKFTEVGNDIYSKFYHTTLGADWIFSNYGA